VQVVGTVRVGVRSSVTDGVFPVFQQILYAAPYSARPANGSVLDPIAAIVVCLPALGGISELPSQPFRAAIQSSTNQFLGRGFGFFLYPLPGMLFFDLFDALSPPAKRAGAASATPTLTFSRSRLYLG
jgi:hypothetical protein